MNYIKRKLDLTLLFILSKNKDFITIKLQR